MLRGFKDFISRGNVIELAVAVVIGSAFNAVVQQFTESFVQPLIKLVTGGKEVSGTFRVNDHVVFDWGKFLQAAITFVITAAVVYFLFVMPMNKLNERRARGQEPPPKAPSDEIRLLTEIRDLLAAGDGGGPGSGSSANAAKGAALGMGAPVSPEPVE